MPPQSLVGCPMAHLTAPAACKYDAWASGTPRKQQVQCLSRLRMLSAGCCPPSCPGGGWTQANRAFHSMQGEGRHEQQPGIKERAPDAKVNFSFKPWRRKTGRDHESSPSAGTSLSHRGARALPPRLGLFGGSHSEQEASCCGLQPCPK